MADIETKIVDRESIMGVKTAKKTITKKKAPIKKAKKKISGPKPAGGGKKNGSAALPPVRLSWGGRMDRLEEALELQSKQTAASEAMLTEKIADMAASVKDLGLNVGGINNSIGKVVEMVLLPGLMEKLNTQFGYQFDNI
ncbi:MAG: hypothetical protein LBB74_03400, partial [Chitinispirillales bacterium]|nr:hypothetical protein [Chitinispirillales bacterium]